MADLPLAMNSSKYRSDYPGDSPANEASKQKKIWQLEDLHPIQVEGESLIERDYQTIDKNQGHLRFKSKLNTSIS
jgi:hypothetical protein